MKQMLIGTVSDRFDFSIRGVRYDAVLVSIKPESAHHGERFVFRLLVNENGNRRPCFAVGMEGTLLGSYCISEQYGAKSDIVQHLATAMSLAEFRVFAVERAVARIPELAAAKPPDVPESPRAGSDKKR